MNQAKGGIQNRENIWTGIKRAVPFLKVNANRNEEDGLQKQAFLNILQTRCSTQQLQPGCFLKTKTWFTDTRNTCPPHKWLSQTLQSGTNVHGRRQRGSLGHLQRGRPCVTTATQLQRVSYPACSTFHLQFQSHGGEESQQSTPTGTSMKKTDSKRSILTIKSKQAAPLRSIHSE